MNTPKHTQGPWRAKYPVVYSASGSELLHIDEYDCATVFDARLIAAAPDLLAALKAILSATCSGAHNKAIHQAQDAIVKAEGETK